MTHHQTNAVPDRTRARLQVCLRLLLVVGLAVTPALAAGIVPADAQGTSAGPPTTTTTAANGTTNQNNSNNGGGGGFGHWIGGIGHAVMNPGQTVASIGSKVTKAVLKKTLVPVINSFILHVPTMGMNGPGGIIGDPTNWPYVNQDGQQTAFFRQIYGRVLLLGFAYGGMALLIGAAIFPLRRNTYRAFSLITRGIGAICAGFVFNLTLNAAYLRLLKLITDALGPTSRQIANIGTLLKLGVTTALVGNQVKELGLEALIAAGIVYATVWIILIFFPMISPVIYAAGLLGPGTRIRQIAKFSIWSYILIGLSKPATALLLRGALALKWTASIPGALSIFVTVSFLILAVAMPFLALGAAWFSRGFAFNAASMVSGAIAGSTAASYVHEKQSAVTQKTKSKIRSKADETAAAGRLAMKGAATGATGLVGDAKNTYRDAKTLVTDADTPSTSEQTNSSSNSTTSQVRSDGGQTTAGKIRDMATSRDWGYTSPSNRATTDSHTTGDDSHATGNNSQDTGGDDE